MITTKLVNDIHAEGSAINLFNLGFLYKGSTWEIFCMFEMANLFQHKNISERTQWLVTEDQKVYLSQDSGNGYHSEWAYFDVEHETVFITAPA
jgi:hypothetical protein